MYTFIFFFKFRIRLCLCWLIFFLTRFDFASWIFSMVLELYFSFIYIYIYSVAMWVWCFWQNHKTITLCAHLKMIRTQHNTQMKKRDAWPWISQSYTLIFIKKILFLSFTFSFRFLELFWNFGDLFHFFPFN